MISMKSYKKLYILFLYYLSSQFDPADSTTTSLYSNNTECGGELTAEAGVILSPNYPHGYPTDIQCEWTITVDDGQVVTLSFNSFSLDFTDHVALYDGDNRYAPLLGEPFYTGYWSHAEAANFSIRSSGHQLHVLFHAQSWPSGLGFSASYSAKECKPFTYGGGGECGQPCPCVQDHTLYCDSTTGRCVCKEGWTSDTCAADINECADPNICTDALSTCTNTHGSYECACKAGLVKTANGLCNDPNLCKQKQCAHACGVISETPRVEQCYCPKGMKLDPQNSQDCVECESWTYGENCSYTTRCSRNNTRSYDRTTGLCHCYPNWTAPDCSEDVNECSLEKPPCSGPGQECYNTRGSYRCYCRHGFEVYNNTECAACGQTLTNSSGYITSPASYVFSGLINRTECSWTIIVGEDRVIALSFLRFDLSYSGHGSVAIYDGLNSNAPLLGVYSSKSPGVVVSTQNSMHIVRLGSSSYSHGYTTHEIHATYISYECPNFHYGPFCNMKCGCVKNNSASCDNHFGNCRCMPGWTGHDCSMDRNECLDNSAACPEYSECKNTMGGFECVCNAGLLTTTLNICSSAIQNGCRHKNCSHACGVIPTANHQLVEQCYCPIGMKLEGNECIDCHNWTYGRDCQKQCPCLLETTLACQPASGKCQCMPGWTGPDCSDDVNECDTQNVCPVYSTCVNLPGNYTCVCETKNGHVNDGPHSCKLKECQYRLNSPSGYFTTPWYPYLYYNNANCTWIISVEKGHIISITIEDFELENQKWCGNDYITLYDGNRRDSNILGKFCRSTSPKLIRSSGNEMMIEFISDAYKTFRGFNISYVSHVCGNFTFGDKCSAPCRCVQNNSRFCDSISGHCTCVAGWRGDRCQVDIDECLVRANICPPNTECFNSPGGYSCTCRLGFKLNTTTKFCEETSDCKAKRCSHSCYLRSGQEICACPDNLQLTSDDQTCVVPYYPYGFRYGDVVLSSDNKDLAINNGTVFVSKPIYIHSGVPFGSSELLQTVARVLTSGAIVLGASGFDNMVSSPNLQHAFSENQFMIAPYWADINPDAGYTTYHVYESCGSSEAGVAAEDIHPEKSNVMRRAARDISEYHNLHGFEPKTVLVVTWVSMEPLVSSTGESSTGGGTNTFQAVLVSGWVQEVNQGHETFAAEESSYVIFLYQKGQMNWNFHPDRIINIGVISDNITMLPTTDSHLVGLIDSVQGNTGYLGVFSFKVGSSKSPAAQCDRYTCSKAGLMSDPVYLEEIRQLYKCPCSLARLGHQWQLFEKRGEFQDVYCYAISTAAKSRFLNTNRRNKLCCYRWTKPADGGWREWEESRKRAPYLGAESQHSGHVLINDPWSWSDLNNSEALENLAAHGACCKLPKSSRCQSFYKIFPDAGCTDIVDFVPGWCFTSTGFLQNF